MIVSHLLRSFGFWAHRKEIAKLLLDRLEQTSHGWDPIIGNLMLKLVLSPVAFDAAHAADGARLGFGMTMTIITTTTPMRGASG